MSLTLPRLPKSVAKASVPASHGIVTLPQRARLARRIAAAARGQGRGRWSPRRLQQAAVQVPALPAELRADPLPSRATPKAVEELRRWLRAAAAQGLLGDEDHVRLRGATPDVAFAVLRQAVERHAAALCAPIAHIVGQAGRRHPASPVAIHLAPLVALDESLASGSDTPLGGDCVLRVVGEECGLLEWRMCETTEDRAIRGALDALAKAVPVAVSSRFGNAGQTCIAAKRFIVVEAVAERFVRAFAEAAAALRTGDPNDEATTLAPMARADLRDELHRQVQASVAKGARVLLGGEPGQGATAYPATLLDGVAPGMPAWDEELFGPVASLIRVRDEAEAIRVANDTAFGLGASVWTADAARGERVAAQVVAGACFVNSLVKSDVRLPFGGTKASGFGRELAGHGIHEFTNIKTVYVA